MIICDNVHKSYRVGHRQKDVLKGINLQIARTDRVGFLGRNGAGKTTLIKMIGGVELPTRGRVVRTMSVSWPLGFAGGFQGSLTGQDNARFIARIYGRDYKDVKAFVEDFTELGAQLKMPVKTYSSGMRARLAFALSIVVDFECYLIDEVILVGDQSFHEKCRRHIFDKSNGRSFVLASHSPDIIRDFCTKAVVIDKGHAVLYENVEEALEVYGSL